MELEEAIKNVKKFNEQRFRDCGVLNQSIDTVLEELNNRIPRKDIEDKKKECENRQFSDFTNEPNFAVEKVLNEILNKE